MIKCKNLNDNSGILDNKNNNLISLLNLDTSKLYIDLKKKILFIEILNSNYSKKDFITLIEYFRNFWYLAKEQNVKYYLLIKITTLPIFPLTFFTHLNNILLSLHDIFEKCMYCCSFVIDSSNSKQFNTINMILNPFLNMYKFVRPFKITHSNEEAFMFFNSITEIK